MSRGRLTLKGAATHSLRTTALEDHVPGKQKAYCQRVHSRRRMQGLDGCTVLQALNQELYMMSSTWIQATDTQVNVFPTQVVLALST